MTLISFPFSINLMSWAEFEASLNLYSEQQQTVQSVVLKANVKLCVFLGAQLCPNMKICLINR